MRVSLFCGLLVFVTVFAMILQLSLEHLCVQHSQQLHQHKNIHQTKKVAFKYPYVIYSHERIYGHTKRTHAHHT